MAVIPNDEKLFMVSKSTNTTYSGSAALKAMNEWYTMQDIIDTVGGGGGVPTLQQVLVAGNFTSGVTIQMINGGISVDSESVCIGATTQNGTAISGIALGSTGTGGYFQGGNGIAVNAIADGVGSIGVKAYTNKATAGYFENGETGIGVYAESISGYGISAYCQNGVGGYFVSDEDYSIVAAGTAAKPGGGSWSAYSDARVKENIKPYTKGLTELLAVNPVNYEYNGLAGTIKNIEYTGVIAQEIKDIFPETVSTYKAKLNETDEEKTELYDFNSTALIFALINAVKELKAEIDLLKTK